MMDGKWRSLIACPVKEGFWYEGFALHMVQPIFAFSLKRRVDFGVWDIMGLSALALDVIPTAPEEKNRRRLAFSFRHL